MGGGMGSNFQVAELTGEVCGKKWGWTSKLPRSSLIVAS